MAPLRTRVVVDDLPRPDQLRPVQHTVDTFAGAEKPPIDNDMERLGKALSQFSTVMAGFARVKEDKANDPRLADAYNIMSSASDPDFIKGLQEGTLPWANVPHIRSLYEADAGQRAGRAALNDVQIGAKAGTLPLVDNDGNPMDVQGIIGQRAPQYMAFPRSPHFMKAFQSTIEAGRNGIAEMQRSRIAEVNQDKVKTLVKSAIEDVVNYSAQGRDDDFLRNELNRRTELAWKVTGTRPADVDALWIGRLQELSKQNPDAAERLLKLDRGKGFDGQPIGALAGNPKYRKEVDEIVRSINDEREKRFDVAERDRLAADAQRRLEAGDGSFNALTSHAYTNPFAARDPSKNAHRMISRETIQDEALARALAKSNADFRRQGLDPATSPAAAETKMRREYEMFVNANRPHPEWQAALQTTGRILSNPVSLSDPKNVERVMRSYQLYHTLAGRNPAYVTETLGVGERERKFYEQLQVYQQFLGDPPQEAARKAADFVNNPPPQLTGSEVKDLRDKADRIDLNGWSLGGTARSLFGDSPQNVQTLRSQVFETAKAIAADRKVPIDKALDAAVERVKDRTVLFNGQVIPPNAHLTKESVPYFQKRLDELFQDNKQVLENTYGIKSGQGLSLREEGKGTGVFRVIGKDGESVIIPQQRPDGTVDYSALRVFSRDIDTIRAQSRKELIDRLAREQKEAADDAIIKAPAAIDGKGLRPNPKAPTDAEREAARKRKLERKYPDGMPEPVPNADPFLR